PPIAASTQLYAYEMLRNHGRGNALRDLLSSGEFRQRSGAGAAFDRAIGTIGVDVERTRGALDDFARDHNFFHTFEARKVEHGLEQDAFEDRLQAAGARLPLDRLARDRTERLVGKGQLDVLHLEQALILLDQRVLRIGQDLLQRSFVEIFQRRNDRQ